jgi:hypothetical protein
MARRTLCAAVAIVALLGAAACSSTSSKAGDSSASSSASASASSPDGSAANVVEIRVSGGTVTGGVHRQKIALGATVVVRVTSDVADEVHVHGYDKKADVEANGSADVEFTADIPGVFEVELEESSLKLVELEIS